MSGPDYPNFDGTQVCAQTDPDAWFPEKGGVNRDAKRMCSSCSWQEPCLEYSLHWLVAGVWAGTTAHQRRRIRERRGIVARALDSDQFITHARIRALLEAGHIPSEIARRVGVSEPVVYRQRDAMAAERGAA